MSEAVAILQRSLAKCVQNRLFDKTQPLALLINTYHLHWNPYSKSCGIGYHRQAGLVHFRWHCPANERFEQAHQDGTAMDGRAASMSTHDQPDENGGKVPESSADDPAAPAKMMPGGASPRQKAAMPRRRRPPPSIWLDHDRTPAQGLVFAIPAGLAMWIVVIYLLKKLS